MAQLRPHLPTAGLGDAWSLHVVDLATGLPVATRQAHVPRLPASTVKLITAAAALLTFGPTHRFTTSVHIDSTSRVVVQGGGDPMLAPKAIAAIADAVAVRMRPGMPMPRVALDHGAYPEFTLAPGWAPDLVPWEVRPVVPVSVWSPGATTAHVRGGMQIAAAIGRRLGGAVAVGAAAVPTDATCIARVRSQALDALVHRMLRDSDSDIAEVLARNVAIGRGLAPTWDGVVRALEGALVDAGISTSGMALADGSGLSRHNRMRADAVTDVLAAAAGPAARPALATMAAALPVAGLSGTLATDDGWFTGALQPVVADRVRAKTGTLRDVCALSGYLDQPAGPRMAFSVLANGTDGWAARQSVSSVVAALIHAGSPT